MLGDEALRFSFQRVLLVGLGKGFDYGFFFVLGGDIVYLLLLLLLGGFRFWTTSSFGLGFGSRGFGFCKGIREKSLAELRVKQDPPPAVGALVDAGAEFGDGVGGGVPHAAAYEAAAWFEVEVVACVGAFAAGAGPGCAVVGLLGWVGVSDGEGGRGVGGGVGGNTL